jgi:predicted NBD/HSP70 family sugar kinase
MCIRDSIAEGYVIETGPRGDARPGKPAILLDIHRDGHRIIGVDLSDSDVFRGAVLDLDGSILTRLEARPEGASGTEVTEIVTRLVADLVATADQPVLGIGVGSPGIVDLSGVVRSAPNLGWHDEPLQQILSTATGLPVYVGNDANAAVLAEHSFGGSTGDLLLIRVGRGVGAGLIIGGRPLFGSTFAAGELGHVVVGTDGGAECACGKRGCLETWLAVPRLRAGIAEAQDDAAREAVVRRAGERLGIALAPVVGALNLDEVVISGPVDLFDGPLTEAAIDTFRARTMAEFHGHLSVRMSELGQDIVMRGAAAIVLSGQLGVS